MLRVWVLGVSVQAATVLKLEPVLLISSSFEFPT